MEKSIADANAEPVTESPVPGAHHHEELTQSTEELTGRCWKSMWGDHLDRHQLNTVRVLFDKRTPQLE